MTALQIAFPHVKKSQANVDDIERQWRPVFSILITPNPGLLRLFRGWIVSENGKDVKQDFKEIIFFEWNDMQTALRCLQLEQFKKFVATIEDWIDAPATVQYHKMSAGVEEFGKAGVPEVVQVVVRNEDDVVKADSAWAQIAGAVGGAAAEPVYGKSINLEEDVFTGLLGWSSFEARSGIVDEPTFKDGLADLKSIGDVTQMIAQLEEMEF
ncbi:MAG: hypothetical protein MMC23_004021 [Stictis urceolatum]|nr:hypothetical protein [Stictis urceolata]